MFSATEIVVGLKLFSGAAMPLKNQPTFLESEFQAGFGQVFGRD
jgi:hypothetical protein